MKKLLLAASCLFSMATEAQLGLKAGINFANVSNASSINNSNRSGFMLGVFIAPKHKKLISSRTELIYSKQGYNYKNGTKTGNVNLDYILIPQLMGINFTKFIQVQLGAQMAFLLNASADSSTSGGGSGSFGSIMNFFNKFDYGFAVGAEIHPYKGLLIGARYNISLGKLYSSVQSGQPPSFASIDAKNNVVQLFAGWTFGKYGSKK